MSMYCVLNTTQAVVCSFVWYVGVIYTTQYNTHNETRHKMNNVFCVVCFGRGEPFNALQHL